ncbi:MAG: hypothetical protein HFG68_07895 [Hungatella sp.]|nr:hypothetical protein [Hungatella sp.]
MKSPANFIRKQVYRLARASHTPIPFFMQLPLTRLFLWIKSSNEVEEEDRKEQKRLAQNT